MFRLQTFLRKAKPKPKFSFISQRPPGVIPQTHNSPSHSQISTNQPPLQLEVERKFLATPLSITYLRTNSLRKPDRSLFTHHEYLGRRKTHDVYFDLPDGHFFSKGIYVRKRDGIWEAKIRSGGDFLNSAFVEVEGLEGVREVVEGELGVLKKGGEEEEGSYDDKGLGGEIVLEDVLNPCAEFVTERESWLIERKFKVDVDTTDFGHVVGEVELVKVIERNMKAREDERKKLERGMQKEIKKLMERYPMAFPAGKAVGKLSAYIAMKDALEKDKTG